MLERLVSMKVEITVFCSGNPDCECLSPSQWLHAENILKLLRPFEEITKDISSQKSLISLIIPAIKVLCNFLSKISIDDPFSAVPTKLISSIQQRFITIEETKIYVVATFLDPRFKERCFRNINLENVQSFILEIFTEQSNRIEEINPNQPSNNDQYLDDDSNVWNIVDKMYKKLPQSPRTSIIEKELNLYLKDNILNRHECPLQWWNRNQLIYPNLQNIARKYLSLPATTVPSERLFSNASDVCTSHRTSLLPENAELLIFLKSNKMFGMYFFLSLVTFFSYLIKCYKMLSHAMLRNLISFGKFRFR